MKKPAKKMELFGSDIKAIIFARVSKTDGSQDVARQVADLREFAKSQNWEVVFEIEEKINLQE